MAALTQSLVPGGAPDVRAAKRLVIKIGSALLVDRASGLKQGWLSALRVVSVKGIGVMAGMLHPRLVVMGPVAGLIDWMAEPMPTPFRGLAMAAGD